MGDSTVSGSKLIGESKLVAASGLFELDFYLQQRPGLAADLSAAIEDYLATGWRINADPSPGFSTEYYLTRNGDVAEAGKNPLLHYIEYGRAEGRAPTFPRDGATSLPFLRPSLLGRRNGKRLPPHSPSRRRAAGRRRGAGLSGLR